MPNAGGEQPYLHRFVVALFKQTHVQQLDTKGGRLAVRTGCDNANTVDRSTLAVCVKVHPFAYVVCPLVLGRQPFVEVLNVVL